LFFTRARCGLRLSGKRQKHPDALAFKRGGRYRPLAPVPAADRPLPAAPRGVGAAAQDVWRRLWRSSLAGAFHDTDVPALRRWLWWLDQWLAVARDVEREGYEGVGALGGPILHPRIRYLRMCESTLQHFEQAFGMNALARIRLGLTLIEQ